MTITSTGLTKAAGAAAAVAGAIFVAVQINHPSGDAFATETAQWVARSCAKLVMCVLALAGLTGMYLRQRRESGVLGLAGYLVFSAGYLALFGVEVVAAAVLPALVGTNPEYVHDVITAALGGTPAGDIGGVQVLLNASGIGYIAGGLLFGIAVVRARVLARWAGALLAVGAVGTAALAVLPESFNRPLAVPVGIALVGLGVSLWRNHRRDAVPAPAPAGTPAVPTTHVPADAAR
jgi:hypothetical protein